MKHGKALARICVMTVILAVLAGCDSGSGGGTPPGGGDTDSSGVIANAAVATEATLRSIPDSYFASARSKYRLVYTHTSHGTHVSRGIFGLPDYKAGDAARFAVSLSVESGSLFVSDSYQGGGIPGSYPDLSQADMSDWVGWLDQNRNYLDDEANADVNLVMWSWCDISGHDVARYCELMDTLIGEYGAGGSKIGIGSGKTRAKPVTFIFMTGHGNPGSNTGTGNPKEQAAYIVEHCRAKGYWCLDYYSIDTTDMAGTYWEDSGDDGNSADYVAAYNAAHPGASSCGSFYGDWQASHAEGADWFYSMGAPGGSAEVGEHNSQYITANRKAYAFWWILARMEGWSPS
jgi:hypothetical protein